MVPHKTMRTPGRKRQVFRYTTLPAICAPHLQYGTMHQYGLLVMPAAIVYHVKYNCKSNSLAKQGIKPIPTLTSPTFTGHFFPDDTGRMSLRRHKIDDSNIRVCKQCSFLKRSLEVSRTERHILPLTPKECLSPLTNESHDAPTSKCQGTPHKMAGQYPTFKFLFSPHTLGPRSSFSECRGKSSHQLHYTLSEIKTGSLNFLHGKYMGTIMLGHTWGSRYHSFPKLQPEVIV